MFQHLKLFGNRAYLSMACTHDTGISVTLLFFSHTVFWNCWAFAQEIFGLRYWSEFCVLQCVVCSVCSYLIVACKAKGLRFPFSLIFLSKDRERLHLIFSWCNTNLHSLVKNNPHNFESSKASKYWLLFWLCLQKWTDHSQQRTFLKGETLWFKRQGRSDLGIHFPFSHLYPNGVSHSFCELYTAPAQSFSVFKFWSFL